MAAGAHSLVLRPAGYRRHRRDDDRKYLSDMIATYACVECATNICSIIALVYTAVTGLFRAWLGGQAVSGWCIAMAIISTLQLLTCVCICCCSSCGANILGPVAYEMYVGEHSKNGFVPS
jgi:hypothetical protein